MKVRFLATIAALLLAGTAACASVDVPDDIAAPTTTQPDTSAGDPPETCLESQAPSESASGAIVDRIRDRGRLVVGVDVGTVLLSSVDPVSLEFEGFDVDIAKEIARGLLGSPDAIQFIGIPSSDREAVLQDGRVDLVADAFTMTCERAENINFSASYFTAHQTVLMRNDTDVTNIEHLAGKQVCMSEGSTAIPNLLAEQPEAEIVTRPERGDCLVALQQGAVGAMATDDAILAGFAAQDPNLEIIDAVQFSNEPYGLGLPKDEPEWASFVNGVLEDVRSSGRWDQLFNEWFAPEGLAISDALPQAENEG